jgi:hypothetical protein
MTVATGIVLVVPVITLITDDKKSLFWCQAELWYLIRIWNPIWRFRAGFKGGFRFLMQEMRFDPQYAFCRVLQRLIDANRHASKHLFSDLENNPGRSANVLGG